MKLFFINKKTPRSGLSFDILPIFLAPLGLYLLAFKSVKWLLAHPLCVNLYTLNYAIQQHIQENYFGKPK